jgi:hypothetical protein
MREDSTRRPTHNGCKWSPRRDSSTWRSSRLWPKSRRLARGVVIEGTPVARMEALVAAVNAAGERAQRRLPILIDGLNEAEDARNWKGPLASLDETLRNYPSQTLGSVSIASCARALLVGSIARVVRRIARDGSGGHYVTSTTTIYHVSLFLRQREPRFGARSRKSWIDTKEKAGN